MDNVWSNIDQVIPRCCICGEYIVTPGAVGASYDSVSCDLRCNKTNAHKSCLDNLEKDKKVICPFCRVCVTK